MSPLNESNLIVDKVKYSLVTFLQLVLSRGISFGNKKNQQSTEWISLISRWHEIHRTVSRCTVKLWYF